MYKREANKIAFYFREFGSPPHRFTRFVRSRIANGKPRNTGFGRMKYTKKQIPFKKPNCTFCYTPIVTHGMMGRYGHLDTYWNNWINAARVTAGPILQSDWIILDQNAKEKINPSSKKRRYAGCVDYPAYPKEYSYHQQKKLSEKTLKLLNRYPQLSALPLRNDGAATHIITAAQKVNFYREIFSGETKQYGSQSPKKCLNNIAANAQTYKHAKP